MFFTPSTRNAIKSSAVNNIEVNQSTNQAIVTFNSGKQYLYSGICEDAMFDIIFGQVKSFGKWVNASCVKDSDVSAFALAWASLTNLYSFHNHPLMQNLFSFNVVSRSSSAINHIVTDLLAGEVLVEYKNGECYSYSNVSRRAILNLLLQKNISLGFWVNENLLFCDAKCATYGSCEHLEFAY